ncbi:lantibiotic dehydratase, partial [Staphylococcus capitis]|uniref:lantibiotic dehydratase n=1 Tax=Staphylococcus capitis TaxID=29388 RepID=UPI001F53E469
FDNDFIRSLQLIHFEMMKYQIMEIGKGKKTFLRIRELMSHLFKAKEYIQIDTKIQTKNNYLSKKIAGNISEAAYLLWLLSPDDLGISTNHDFHYSFLEKYGLEQIVNLKELLSDINGMGYCTNEDKPIKNNSSFLKEKYYYALSHKEEIEITENDFLDLEKKNTIPIERAPLSSEIYSEFYYGNCINGYDEFLVISPIVSSFNAGATMGRFSQEIDRDIRKQLDNEIYEQYIEYSNENNTEVIHINEIPKYARNLNINHSGTTKFKELDLDMPCSSITLDDLYVGSTFDKLYLFSKTSNSRILFITHSMLNYVLCSNLYRFLREVSLGNTKFIQPIKDDGIEGFNYCPRIRYKNVILKPATWILNKDMFSSSEKENWIEQFHKIQQFYNIPNDVTMAFGDNRLTINLSNDAHISILKKEIEKQGRVCLLEDFISKSNNDRVIEIVTPIYRKAKSNEKRITIPKNIYKRLETKREWLSIHLYIDESYQNEFLIQYILPCIR